MKFFEYQARCGNQFFARIEVQEIYNGKRVYKGIMMHGSGGRSRWNKSRIDARWIIEEFKGYMLEMDNSTDFTPGIKKVKEWENLTGLTEFN